ncbi:unnamed protein product, partial (macronuclear) [Paramecium tetraurelia]
MVGKIILQWPQGKIKWIAAWKWETLKDVGGWYLNNGEKHGQWIDIIKNYQTKAQIYESGRIYEQKEVRQMEKCHHKQSLRSGGGYYEDGSDSVKIGKWIELIDNYQQFSQVSYNGEYNNGKKVGLWDIFHQVQKRIGGGSYDKRGIKVGKWIELSDGSYKYSQVSYIGEYYNGKKVGRWNICQWDPYTNTNQQIGGGSYDQEGDSIKIGRWIELSDGFCRDSQVTYIGVHKNGKKVGRWDLWYAERERPLIKNELIGGRSYNEIGDEIKFGMWTEQSDGYLDRSQVTYNGEYKNGQKVGQWDIFVKNRRTGSDEKIGGGQYDQKGSGIKTGKWVELSDDYHDCSQVTQVGIYENGKKIGRWDILYKNRDTNINELIGGGSYNKLNDGYKIGTWIELNDWFSDSSQVTNNGEYKDGLKFGRWDIWYKNRDTKLYQLMQDTIKHLCCSGGGFYQDDVNQIKLGIWIELNDGFWDYSQVTQHGKYQNGKKVGRWVFKFEGSQIGGGLYNEEGEGLHQL